MITAIASRVEVMKWMEDFVHEKMTEFLKSVEDSWQPADLLPDARMENFFEEVKNLQERARDLSYDLLAVLVGDTITEEALPTYESWLMSIKDMPSSEESPWMRWNRAWTAEENRHGDLLNKYLYLTGRINMREMEASTQYLIADGFDLQPVAAGTARGCGRAGRQADQERGDQGRQSSGHAGSVPVQGRDGLPQRKNRGLGRGSGHTIDNAFSFCSFRPFSR